MLVSQKLGVKDLSGPVGIVKTVGDQYTQAAAYGFKTVFLTMVNWIILISANLGVMNLLPLPALDGGRLLFLNHRSNYWKGCATEYGSAGTHCRVDLINAFDGICNVSGYCKDFHVKGDLHVYKKSDKSYFDRRC